MKAFLVKKFGALVTHGIENVDDPTPGSDEVLIKVRYAGINYPDLLIVKGKYQYRPDLPFSPGGEVAGDIIECGKDVIGFKQGDRVLAGVGWGGYAEFTCAPISNTYHIPQGVDYRNAANLLETYATAYHALKDRAALKKNEKLLVLGAAGGTGSAAVQLGKLMGVEVLALASSKEKLDFAKQNGADRVINYLEEDVNISLKELGGVDVIFDPVGGFISENVFRTLRPGGRHLVIGFASGHIPAIPWNLPLLKQSSIVGVSWGGLWRQFPELNRNNVYQLLTWLEQGLIQPQINGEYELRDAVRAMKTLEERRVIGNVCLKIG